MFEVPPCEQKLFKPVLNKIEPFESIFPLLEDCFEIVLRFISRNSLSEWNEKKSRAKIVP